jgi:hypothetical protein
MRTSHRHRGWRLPVWSAAGCGSREDFFCFFAFFGPRTGCGGGAN